MLKKSKASTDPKAFTNAELLQLLAINKAITEAKNAVDLLAAIRHTVMGLIPFYDTGILIVEKDGMHHFDMAVNIEGWDVSIGNKKLYERGLLKIVHKGSYVEYVEKLIEECQSPVIEDYTVRLKEFNYPFFTVLEDVGYKEGLVTVLKANGKTFGTFWLNSLEKDHFKKEQFSLFQAIAEQVSIAAANIIANEEIREREKEKTILLSISEAVATIRDKKELLKFVFEKVKPLFGFYDAGFFVFSHNKQFIEDWTVAMPEISPSAVNYKIAENKASSFLFPASALETFYKQLKENKGPAKGYYNEELFARFPNYPQWDAIKEMGYKESIGTLLRAEEGDLGILFFNSLTENHFSDAQFSLFQGIADQLATAVANILANEEILEREKEKDILLTISQKLGNATKADELLGIIINEVKPVFNFYDTGILVIDDKAKGVYDLSVVYPHIDNSEVNDFLNNKGYYKDNQLIKLEHSVVEWILEKFDLQNIPFIFDYLQDYSSFSDGGLLADLKNGGYISAWMCPLVQQGKIFGILSLNFMKSQAIPLEKEALFLALADRIASSLSNILANHEILKREKEKSQLLEISEAIATVQNSKQLLKVIYEKIQPVFEYDNAGLYILDKDGNNCYEITDFEVLPDAIQQEIQGRNLLGPIPMADFSPDFWFNYREPAITNMQLQAGYLINNNPGKEQFDIGLAHGLQEMICGPLNCAGRKIGMLCFSVKRENFYSAQHINLFRSLSDLIAIAVANILANEEILEREKEKTLLLNISNSIAQINNKVDLLKSINELLWPIFHHDDAGFSIVDKERKFFTDYHNLYSEEIPASEEAKYLNSVIYREVYNVADSTIPFPGSIVEHYMYRKPEMGKLENVLELGANTDLLTLEIQHGLVYYICSPLSVGGKTLGLFNLLFKEENKPSESFLGLFTQIADIMALAFSNILANEEIIEREREKTILLELTELIAQVKNKNDLLRLIVNKIKPLFNFHDCGLFILSKNGLHHSDLAAVLPDVSSSEWNEKNASVSTDIPHKDSPVEWIINAIENAQQPVLVDFVDLVEKFPHYPQFDGTGLLEMGYRDCLATNLKVGGKTIGMFCINVLAKDFFPITKYSILQSVGDTLAIAVANILANEEILEREREKIILLSLSENMANIRNRENLMQTMLEKIKPIVQFDDSVISKYNSDFTQYEHIIASAPPERKQHPLFAEMVGKQVPIKNHPAEYVLENIKQLDVFEYDADELIAMYPEHFIGSFLKENGLLYNLYFKLVWAGDIIGFMSFHFSKKDNIEKTKFGLYKSIAEQVSVALANILANEELVSKAKEIDSLNKQLQVQNEYLIEEVEQQYNFDEMIGQNTQFADVCRNIGLVAKTDSSVLILGETGTGKELVARAIHNNSDRKNKPLIKLNCAALPANLIESELFGHERGAFTGAIERRIGKFELANGSTLFLDEVGELPTELQSKLLRALQEREIERLGSNKTLKVDVRIIAATNRELEKEVQAGKFRQDLYYRLHIFPINLPALRERKEDIPLLAAHFIERYAKKTGKKIQGLSSHALQEMMSYNWPGNIRELEHVIERSVILAKSKLIQDLNLPLSSKKRISTSPTEFVIKSWEEQQRDYILEVLKVTKGNMAGKGGAAELLQLPPTTLQSKMNKLGIKRKHYIAL